MDENMRKAIAKLFNNGTLNVYTANFLHEIGYAIICADGKVMNIIKEN